MHPSTAPQYHHALSPREAIQHKALHLVLCLMTPIHFNTNLMFWVYIKGQLWHKLL